MYKKIFYDHLYTCIIFGDVGTWLLGYRIVLSYLYIPQGHFFKSTLWLWSKDEYKILDFEQKPIIKSTEERNMNQPNVGVKEDSTLPD